MPDRIRTERIPEGLKTPKDIWDECKELPPNEWLPKLFWLADDKGNLIKVEVKVGREKIESNLVFAFHISEENRFEAHEARATAENDFEISDSYPYHGLAKAIRKKFGAAGFIEATRKTSTGEEDDIPPSEGESQFLPRPPLASPETPVPPALETLAPSVPTGVYRAIGSTRERLAAHNIRARQKYSEDIVRVRSDRNFSRLWHERFDTYNLPERIAALPETRAKDGLILIRSRALRPGFRPGQLGDTDAAMAETLTIRLLQKKRVLEAGKDIIELLPLQKVALATLVQGVEDVGKSDSPFRRALIAAGIQQVYLEAVVWYEEARETYDLHVPIAYSPVPKRENG
ncbi:hypothetical protein A3A38_03820 [Candidatus Kaiserbacteria bacterium RIFCSPLOWO2_01_FULL_53_17]|uniref:Uncharacterized protein n=1 Tax=Candidatus Kaiserbacteria bacterium RIFCSPLOWO2_01_FULL_53_17 TaxID=1798511 RepID=A0A1F6EHX1_9BACT|nr:MAG: hypothetical protein A3A38_03820 [Candidatus Kaiserbacteria bacterium RIFCSPLOWO2_01_FULL_53_17]